ncbi:MAG: hypothetical protein EZS28_050842 [Streblomastix strix]|uniref:Uncharacterized protein n=1 Tax=Streblomastix strix TaxID=222440 RepID=A0A5J4T7E3_9EUKA|nr:MAG: hypothetical protein EZS28_050842 [Streblomastix strix]
MEKEYQDDHINSQPKIFWNEEIKNFSEWIRNNQVKDSQNVKYIKIGPNGGILCNLCSTHPKLARTVDQAFVVEEAYTSHFDALPRHLGSDTQQRCEEVSELVPISMCDKDFKDGAMKMIRIVYKNAKKQIPNFRISDIIELIIDEGDSDLLR